MLASRAIDRPTGANRLGGGIGAPAGLAACRTLVGAIGPALDTAFGLEHAALFPEAIAALVAEIEAGPLGTSSAEPLELA